MTRGRCSVLCCAVPSDRTAVQRARALSACGAHVNWAHPQACPCASMRGFLFKGVGDRAPRRPEPGSSAEPGTDAVGGDLFARIRASVRAPHAPRALCLPLLACCPPLGLLRPMRLRVWRNVRLELFLLHDAICLLWSIQAHGAVHVFLSVRRTWLRPRSSVACVLGGGHGVARPQLWCGAV